MKKTLKTSHNSSEKFFKNIIKALYAHKSFRYFLFISIVLSSVQPYALYAQEGSDVEVNSTHVGQNVDMEAIEREVNKRVEAGLLDEKLICATQQLKQVDALLEELAQIVQNGLVKHVNKKELLEKIRHMRVFISNLIERSVSQVNEQTLVILLQVTHYLIDILRKSIKNGLQDISEISLEEGALFGQDFLQATAKKSCLVTPEQIETLFVQNETAYQELRKAAETVGLSWANWLYRTLIVSPYRAAKKKHLLTVVKWGLISGVTLCYLLHHFTDKLDGICGPAAKTDDLGRVTNEGELWWLGNLERKLIQFKTGGMPIATMVLAAAPVVAYAELKKLKNWGVQALKNAHGVLMGGVEYKKSQAGYDCRTPRYTFDDVVGLDHAKKELEPIVEYIKNCARFERVGIGPEKGYLFAGKPGTGKTHMAEALAGEIRRALQESGVSGDTFKFMSFEASQIYEIIMCKGVGPGIEEVLEQARKNAPCIVFIDEPDLLGLQRTSNRELLSKLLNAMNGFLSNNMSENVILLAATNQPDNLDPALLRRGRLGKIIYFEYPTFEARKEYLLKKLSPIVPDIIAFDIDKLARQTRNCTFEALQSMVRKAFQKTKIHGTALTQRALEDALNEEVRNILVDSKEISEKELQVVAVHQAGAALASMLLDPCEKLACVTINPTMKRIRESCVWARYWEEEEKIITRGKLFTYKEKDSDDISSYDELIKLCKISIAGSAAEEILLGSSGHSYNKDAREKAFSICLSLVCKGLKCKNMPKELKDQYYKQALELLETCEAEARVLLQAHKDTLVRLSQALIEHRTLDRDQVQQLLCDN